MPRGVQSRAADKRVQADLAITRSAKEQLTRLETDVAGSGKSCAAVHRTARMRPRLIPTSQCEGPAIGPTVGPTRRLCAPSLTRAIALPLLGLLALSLARDSRKQPRPLSFNKTPLYRASAIRSRPLRSQDLRPKPRLVKDSCARSSNGCPLHPLARPPQLSLLPRQADGTYRHRVTGMSGPFGCLASRRPAAVP